MRWHARNVLDNDDDINDINDFNYNDNDILTSRR